MAAPILIDAGTYAARQLIGITIRLVAGYASAAYSKSAQKELRAAMVAALSSAAPRPVPQAATEDQGLVEKARHWYTEGRERRRLKRKNKKSGKSVLGQEWRPDELVVASMDDAQLDWRTILAAQILAAAQQGRQNQDIGVQKGWTKLTGSQDLGDWSKKVAVQFGLEVQAREKLGFLRAQLENDQERARFLADLAVAKQVSYAIYTVSVSLLLGGGGIAVAVALH